MTQAANAADALPVRRERRTLGLLLGVIGVIIFGLSVPMTRLALVAFDAGFVTAARAAGAGLLALAVLLVLRRRIPWEHRTALSLVALTIVGLFPTLLALGMRSVPAAHGGVVLGILPLATAVAATLLAGDRPSLWFWVVAVAGSLLVLIFTVLSGGGAITQDHAYLVLAVLATSIGYTLSAILARTMPGWEVISWALVIALPVSLPLALVWWPGGLLQAPHGPLGGLAYVMVMSQYFGFFAWNAGLAIGGVARVGQVQLLQIFVTIAGAAVLDTVPIDRMTLVFAGLVFVIVLLGQRTKIASQAKSSVID